MPNAVTLIRSSSLSDAAEYAYAATAPADARLIFLAGSCPLNEDGSTTGVGDYAAQAAKCIENMSTALSEAGASIEDVISTRVLVASTKQADLVTAWEVVRDAFGEHDAPSTLLGVKSLDMTTSLLRLRRSQRSATEETVLPRGPSVPRRRSPANSGSGNHLRTAADGGSPLADRERMSAPVRAKPHRAKCGPHM